VIVLPGEIALQIESMGLVLPGPSTVWDGEPAEPPAECLFYVPAYMTTEWAFEAMRLMPQLQVCQLPTAGFEHALDWLPSGVTLCNAAGVHDASTAELALGLILARLRNLDVIARDMLAGRSAPERSESLADKRVVIIGAGGIGRALARRLSGFECDVVLVARSERAGVRSIADIDELMPSTDIVVIAVPLDDSTRRLVDAAFLSRLRDGALVVNVARGGILDTDAVLNEVGRLSFALDVTDPEPLPPDHPLWLAPGVLISPHVGGNSTAFLPRIGRLVAEQLARWGSGEPLRNVVVS
jgi:phosphoglycerate dehydrogenase-like enzyme